MEQRKKKVLVHSNFCKMLTGFGKHKKNLLKYLFSTGKYEIIELSNGYQWDTDILKTTPWKGVGSLPNDLQALSEIDSNEKRKLAAGYGAETIDRAIEEFKPDIYLGIEDIWAFNTFYDKLWWNKVNCIVHTTLDSLPILPDAVEAAKHIKHYLVWATFAEKALHEEGYKHVKTVRGIVDSSGFFKLDDANRDKLKSTFGVKDNFIIGFVFRNQLRKSAPALLEGFKLFDQQNPSAKAKLLLHTHWSEGWDIPRLIKEKNIDGNKILTTYFCKKCANYMVTPFRGQDVQCGFCQTKDSCETTNIHKGVNEQQLNEIYNIMDVYCHPFSSGGQEIPIQEAKLAELITLVTNYSCGEDCCTEESGGLPLEWSEYREPGTQFIKATTSPSSIASQIEKVFKMTSEERSLIGKKARQFVVDNFSIQTVGRQFEELFDSLPYVDFDQNTTEVKCDPFFIPDDSLPDEEWVNSLYLNILGRKDFSGTSHWVKRLNTDLNKEAVLSHFRKVALEESQKSYLNEMLAAIKLSTNKRIAFVLPDKDEEVIASTSLLPSIKKLYPEYEIFYFTKSAYFDWVTNNPFVTKVLNYFDKMDDPLYLEGLCSDKGYFDIVLAPKLGDPFFILNERNERVLCIKYNFTRNSCDRLKLNIYEQN